MTDPAWRADPAAVIQRANVLLGLRRVEQAVELLRSAVAARPDRADLWGQVSAALLGADRPAEALAVAEELVSAPWWGPAAPGRPPRWTRSSGPCWSGRSAPRCRPGCRCWPARARPAAGRPARWPPEPPTRARMLVLSPPGCRDPRPYYRAVAAAADDLPVLAYHYPAVSPPGLAVGVLAKLPVLGVKDSSGDAERLLCEVAGYSGAVYVGSSVLLTTAGAVGAAGAILALANAEPELCIAAFAGGRAAQLGLLAAHQTAAGDFPAGIKRLVADRWGYSTAASIGR